MRKLPLGWKLFLALALLAGCLLRFTFVEDMEYKEDEEYNFTQSQMIGNTHPWPWVGMNSGVYIPNPGMSIWVFAGLAKISHAKTPTALAHAVQAFSLFGILLILPFAFYFVKPAEREPWLWAYALSMVNPFAILYQRKLWPEPFLPAFLIFMLMGWWKKQKFWGAFFWGLAGALIGQIHMSGFFMAGALTLWTALSRDRRSETHWIGWFLGSTFGALPLIPWACISIHQQLGGSVSGGMNEALQLKYWVFWITDPLGLHLGNPLGLVLGSSLFAQISDFVRYPLVNGKPTYLVGTFHIFVLTLAVLIFARGAPEILRIRKRKLAFLLGTGQSPDTHFVQGAALWGCGGLLTITGVMIRRYYMAATFPFEMIWLSRTALLSQKAGRSILLALWGLQLLISAHFVHYIHVNQGSLKGDYGQAYHLIRDSRLNAGPRLPDEPSTNP